MTRAEAQRVLEALHAAQAAFYAGHDGEWALRELLTEDVRWHVPGRNAIAGDHDGIEAVLAGGEVVRIRPVPRRAAGPDLRHVVIGNEGALAFVTEVTVKVFRVPEHRRHQGYLVPDLSTGVGLLREVVTAGHRPSVCRVYDSGDAGQHFDFVGDQALVVVVTTIAMGTLKVFDIVRTMTGGNFGTSVVANEFYTQSFRQNNAGLGAALAVILFLLVIPLVIYNVRQMRMVEEIR